MFASFLLSKLFRSNKKILPVFSTTTNPAALLQKDCVFLRRISSNTSCAQPSTLANTSAAGESTLKKKDLNRDYTVSYLIQSCGLSPKDAASASERIRFASPETSNSLLNVLRNHGFTMTQITTIVRVHPKLLLSNVEKTILPKLEFLLSIGLSTCELARIVSCNPFLLPRSLKSHIKPICNLVKSLVQSDERVCKAIKRSPWLLLQNHTKFIVPKIELLQKLGVSASCISLFVTHFPRILTLNHEQFSAGVSKVKEMGFDPSKSTFVLAVEVLSWKDSMLIWDRSYKIYSTKWGWSEEDILSAFKKHPHCMTLSEEKIESAMEFLVNTMGWSSKNIAKQPCILLLSLKKRIIPRCCVIRVLWRKGLVRKDLSPGTVLVRVEKVFLERYVTKYEQQVPQLLSVYEGEMDALDL